MKKIDGIEALKEILKIEKEIELQEKKIEEMELFGKEYINLIPSLDIYKIVEKLLKLPPENLEKGICNDWVANIIFEYIDDNISLDEAINYLIKEE